MNAFLSLLGGHRLSMALVVAGLVTLASPVHAQYRSYPSDSRSRSTREYQDRESFPKTWRGTRGSTRPSSTLPDSLFDLYDQDDRLPVSRRRVPTFRDSYDSRDSFDSRFDSRHEDRFNWSDDRDTSAPLRGWEEVDQYGVSDQWPQTEIRKRIPWTEPSQPRLPVRPTVPTSHDERPTIQQALTSRYQDAALLRFASALPAQQGLTLYGEVLAYIAERHLEPPPAQAMAQRGLYNLSQATQNPAFLQATRINPQMARSQELQQAIAQLARQPVTRSEDAVALLRQSMTTLQPFGIPASVVTLEFVEGALDGLDRFSAFLPAETAASQNQQLSDSLVGIGVTIEATEGGMKVLKTIANSPAAQAGLKKGDLIVAVNGQSLEGLTLDGAISLLTGAEGSVAHIGIDRAGQTAQMSITRRRVQTYSVNDVQLIDPSAKVGYLKLDVFGAKSKAEMEAALMSLHQQGMQALILDVRGNPGGLLTAAIEISDIFLPQGTIVSTRGRNAQDDSTTTARKEQTWKVPMVVLIDGDSASASEILAAAIQDNGRGVIVGRHSYGKGTVQTLFPLKTANCSLRLTTAKFYSPSGRPMSGQGVEPDIASNEGTDAQGRELDVLAGIDAARNLLTRSR